jgi:hypothetical protein
MEHTLPFLKASGGELLFYGRGGDFLIGPTSERWDAAMLVSQSTVASFLAFASNQDYLAGIGHRTAALEDSRLLPLVESQTQLRVDVARRYVARISKQPRGAAGTRLLCSGKFTYVSARPLKYSVSRISNGARSWLRSSESITST